MAVKEKALRRLAEKLHTTDVTWAVGAGYLLQCKGVADGYHGFDMLIAQEDVEKADKVLSRLGMRSEDAASDTFHCTYHFDGADVDVRAPFVVEGKYHLRFNKASVAEQVKVLGVQVPLMYLEDWYVLYALWGRTRQVEQLAAYFQQHGVQHPERFQQVVQEPLPEEMQRAIALWRKG